MSQPPFDHPKLILAKKGAAAGSTCPNCHAIPLATLKQAHRIFEKSFITHVLKRNAGDPCRTAVALDVSVSTLKARISRHGIDLLDPDLMADAVWSLNPSPSATVPSSRGDTPGAPVSPPVERRGSYSRIDVV